MSTLQSDFVDIAAGLLVCAVGLLALTVSLFRLKSKDHALLNFGLFALLSGLQRLAELKTMEALVGFPFSFPYSHGLLTYFMVIPLSALLVNLFGRGLYNSMAWVYRSTIAYAVVAIPYDLLRPGPLTDVAIYRPLVVAWGLVWIVNILSPRRRRDLELRVLQATFLITVGFMVIDQLISIGVLSWNANLLQPGYFALFAGLGIVAVHHFFDSERKLQFIEREIEIARRIQESNLPLKSSFPRGIDIAARYIPMSTVAGNFYDIKMKDQTGVGVLIADVSGHGVGAALIGSMLKVCFASQAAYIDDPAHVLTEINRILQGNVENSFITACSLFVDFKNEILRYSVAGHPPPFLLRKSKDDIIRLSHGGTVLGPFSNIVYENDEQRIEKGDRLVLYTDGLIEAKSRAGEFYGDQRLEVLVKSQSDDSPEKAADRIVGQIVSWSGRSTGRSPDDDLTLVIMDIDPSFP